ncbi:MAG: ABC-2 type transport system permease protein [Acidimicrobiales bacterium]|jgi:ABC-2 type transport system permease protein
MNRVLVLYRLFLRRQVTTGRLFLFGGFGLMAVAVAFAINRNGSAEDTVNFIYGFGLSLMVPVIALVLASSSLGELVEDETLVYLWHRPTPRWMLATGAWMGAATIALPFTVIPLTAAGALGSGGDRTVIVSVAVATSLAAIAYTGLFVLLGLLFRKALIWGLIYLVVWELFVSRAGAGAARLSINTYPSSVLARMTDYSLPLADRAMAAGIIVPILVALAGIGLTAWRLENIDVA